MAQRAGVGIGALYHRYQGKEELLASLCARGQDTYLAELERAIASDSEQWEALVEFLQRIVDEDTHSLVVRLAGTFTPTPEHEHNAARMRELSLAVSASGGPKPLLFVFAFCAGITPSAPALVRSRWSHLLAGNEQVHTAYSWETVLDEVCFISARPWRSA